MSVSRWWAKVDNEDGWVSKIAGERVGRDSGEGNVDGGLQVHIAIRHFTFHTSSLFDVTPVHVVDISTSLHDHFYLCPSIVLKH